MQFWAFIKYDIKFSARIYDSRQSCNNWVSLKDLENKNLSVNCWSLYYIFAFGIRVQAFLTLIN